MSLSQPIIAILNEFRTAFYEPTWEKILVLIIGTVLARGRRTVTAALRAMGLHTERHFSNYHQVLNRAAWSPRELSRRLLLLLHRTFGGCVRIVIDEHLERRWGPQISKRGHHRDSLASSRKRSVSTSGLRWITMALVVRVPWTSRHWALPFLSVLTTTPEVDKQAGRRHKTIAQWARQMITQVRRWLPDVPIQLIGDGAYSVIDLGLRCAKLGVALIAPLRLDARLYAPASAVKAKIGRPRKVGARLPNLSAVLVDPQTVWQSITIDWYGGQRRTLAITSGTALWYHPGFTPLPIRWVLVRDPQGNRAEGPNQRSALRRDRRSLLDPKAYFSTDLTQTAEQIVTSFVLRWTIEVTFEESRAHMGIETQRQRSDPAIERTTPALFGLYSLVALLAHALYPDGRIPIQATAWYAKTQPTFADVLAAVRRRLWDDTSFCISTVDPDMLLIPKSEWQRLMQALCYAH